MVIILIQKDRWSRLERYARWKQNGFHMSLLPNDVLFLLISFLQGSDLHNFIEACIGYAPTLEHRINSLPLPTEIWMVWFFDKVLHTFESHLMHMGNSALFYSNKNTNVSAVVDWSPFSSSPFSPISQYSWSSSFPPHPYMNVDSLRVRQIIRETYRKRTCAIRISLHLNIRIGQSDIVVPHPILTQLYFLFPSWIVN